MVKVKLAYGRKGIEVELPQGQIQIIEPRYRKGGRDQAGMVLEALREPIGSPPLGELVSQEDRVGIIINDITRATPNEIILPVLIKELENAGVSSGNIILFNATGTHRLNTKEELTGILGEKIAADYRIVQNNAGEQATFVKAGTTSRGTEIRLNREFMDCNMHILTGFIEPHFFAGFSGGPKAIMPGMASLETIITNHGPANIDHPGATWGITRGNPIWEEMLEAARMVPRRFLLNVTLNRNKEITGVFAGEMEEAHSRGCLFARESAMMEAECPFDIVITTNSGYPLDLNLYQTVKGMSTALQIVKKGGAIVVVSECREGIPEHGSYGKLLREAENPDALLKKIRSAGFHEVDSWEAQIHALVCKKADVYIYSDGLTDKQIREAMLRPSHSIEETVEELLKKYGNKARICVLPEGPQTIPYLRDLSHVSQGT